jgi:hypothetical protein
MCLRSCVCVCACAYTVLDASATLSEM